MRLKNNHEYLKGCEKARRKLVEGVQDGSDEAHNLISMFNTLASDVFGGTLDKRRFEEVVQTLRTVEAQVMNNSFSYTSKIYDALGHVRNLLWLCSREYDSLPQVDKTSDKIKTNTKKRYS